MYACVATAREKDDPSLQRGGGHRPPPVNMIIDWPPLAVVEAVLEATIYLSCTLCGLHSYAAPLRGRLTFICGRSAGTGPKEAGRGGNNSCEGVQMLVLPTHSRCCFGENFLASFCESPKRASWDSDRSSIYTPCKCTTTSWDGLWAFRSPSSSLRLPQVSLLTAI